MNIAILGGCGYVSSALVPALLDYGYNVKVIDLLWFGNHLPKEVNVIQKDLFECTEKDFEGIDVCVNLSGYSSDPMAEFDPVRCFIYNASMPLYLALMAKRAGVKRFIQASSASVYGFTFNELYKEDAIVKCDFPYGNSKYASEQGLMHLQDNKFSVICLRKGTISGYSPRLRLDLIVNQMFKTAMTNERIIINNPSIWRPILSVKSAVSSYIRSLQVNESISGIFNVCDENYTVSEIAEIVKLTIEKRTGKKISFDVKNIKDVRNYKIDITKAKTILGFHPRYTVEDIVDDLLDNWDKFKDDINDDKYYNINVCKKIFKEKVKL